MFAPERPRSPVSVAVGETEGALSMDTTTRPLALVRSAFRESNTPPTERHNIVPAELTLVD